MCLKMVIPKGRIQQKVLSLLNDMGIRLLGDERNYRPAVEGFDLEVKVLKSQNIPTLVDIGQHDVGFAGLDWIQEQSAEVTLLQDLKFDPVKIVACIPEDWNWEELKQRQLIVASEYPQLAEQFLREQQVNFRLIRSYGATEVFPPEDADMVIDNTSTGTTIRANRLKQIATLMTSSTQFFANTSTLKDPAKKAAIDELLVLMRGVLNGRDRVLLEMNCPPEKLEQVVDLLPAMRAPTVSTLYQERGYAIKAAVAKSAVSDLIPKLLTVGATDILEMPIRKVL